MAFALAAFCWVSHLGATSVIPPTFEELVERSSQIVRFKVTAVNSRWETTPQGPAIHTYVTGTVLKTLKGAGESQVVLRLLGGTVGDFSMKVSDMPEFEVGQTYIGFIALNGVAFCPLVGVMHGSYPVVTDPATQTEVVVRSNRRPLRSVDDVVLPLTQSNSPALLAASGAPMTRAAFEDAIAKELSRAVK